MGSRPGLCLYLSRILISSVYRLALLSIFRFPSLLPSTLLPHITHPSPFVPSFPPYDLFPT
jgi:hypothetical protein